LENIDFKEYFISLLEKSEIKVPDEKITQMLKFLELLYKKNQSKVDSFLRKQGINIKTSSEATYDNMNLEELMTTKEHLEDLIAEKELSTNTASAEAVVETETK